MLCCVRRLNSRYRLDGGRSAQPVLPGCLWRQCAGSDQRLDLQGECDTSPASVGLHCLMNDYGRISVFYQLIRLFCFAHLAEVGKSLKNDVDCMLLTIADRKAFACKDVVIHRYDRPAAAAKQAAQGCDGSGFAVCVRVEPSKIGARSWILFQRKAAPPSRRLLSRSLMLHKPCISFSMEQ